MKKYRSARAVNGCYNVSIVINGNVYEKKMFKKGRFHEVVNGILHDLQFELYGIKDWYISDITFQGSSIL